MVSKNELKRKIESSIQVERFEEIKFKKFVQNF